MKIRLHPCHRQQKQIQQQHKADCWTLTFIGSFVGICALYMSKLITNIPGVHAGYCFFHMVFSVGAPIGWCCSFVWGHVLGSGSFSTVKYAKRIQQHVPGSKWREYAVKIVPAELLEDPEVTAAVDREVSILRRLSCHPNIAGLVSVFSFRKARFVESSRISAFLVHVVSQQSGQL